MKLTTQKINLIIIVCFWLNIHNPVVADDSKYSLVIFKSERLLNVKHGNKTIKKYSIAYGKGGKGTKRKLGDNKTPVGVYKIIDFNNESKFHFFMQLDYPNLLDAWYGYKNNIISARDFKSITSAYKQKKLPPQNTPLGGHIGIHGMGLVTEEKLYIHEEFNWTEGCIALTNDEINDLRKYVTIGTKVVIKE